MPLPDAEARRMERFLEALTPPAAMTATYRQQVVQASFDARMKAMARRQRQRAAVSVVLFIGFLCLLAWTPAWCSRPTGWASFPIRWPASSTVSAEFLTGPLSSTIDGYESALIQSHVQMRRLRTTQQTLPATDVRRHH